MSEIKIDKRNYRKHSDRNKSLINKSLSECGAGRSILIDNENSIVAGNGIFEQAQKLDIPIRVIETDGTELIAVKRTDLASDDDKRRQLAIMDNSTSDSSEFDMELLAEDFDVDVLSEFGVDVADFCLSDEAKEDDFDASEIPDDEKPLTKRGDVWILGNHRLLCGDSTKIEDVESLMNGEKADMVFTDPPYNVKVSDISGLGKTKHEEFVMASGEMSEEEFIQFLTDVFTNLATVSKDGSIHYVCMDWKHIYEILSAGRKAYTEFKQLCVWNKGVGGMGGFYRSQHELIFVFKHGTAAHTNNFGLGEKGRYRTNVWDYPGMNSFAAQDRSELQNLHPTVKPLALVADAILDCSNRNELILDLFGGSGTTLLAAEKTQRKCCTMELDEHYCDVIIRRWQKFTGADAVLESTSETFNDLEKRANDTADA